MQHEAIRATLYALAERNNGRLTPEQVVESARDPASPLHSEFTWSDDKAAAAHRLNEARALIRSVKVEVRTEHFSISAPAFIRDPEAGRSQGYSSLGRLRTNEEAAREAVVSEFGRASAALARAKSIAVALGLGDQIEEINQQILVLTERASQEHVGTEPN